MLMHYSKNIIIGAGLSGLACAYNLKDCLVLEKEATLGGLCRTVTYNGLRFDLGGHRLFTSNPAIDRFFHNLLKDQCVEVERQSKIYWNRKFIDYPLKKSVILQLNPWQAGLGLMTFLLRKVFPLQEYSFAERAANRFGDELYALFLKNYTQKVWGIPCEEICKELVDIRLQNISLLRAIQHAINKDQQIRSFADKFLYPKLGIVQLADRLARDVPILLKTTVTNLETSDRRVSRVEINHEQWLECDQLISTMPLPLLIKFFEAPTAVQSAAQRLTYRSLIFVFLILNKKQYSREHWVYFPGQEIFGRIHEPKNWSPDMADETRTGLCCEIFCSPDDRVWSISDAEIAHQTIRDLPAVSRFDIVDHAVVREQFAYPVYTKDYSRDLQTVTRYLEQYENLTLLGRTGSFQYINMDVCLESGLALGNKLSLQKSSPREISCRS